MRKIPLATSVARNSEIARREEVLRKRMQRRKRAAADAKRERLRAKEEAEQERLRATAKAEQEKVREAELAALEKQRSKRERGKAESEQRLEKVIFSIVQVALKGHKSIRVNISHEEATELLGRDFVINGRATIAGQAWGSVNQLRGFLDEDAPDLRPMLRKSINFAWLWNHSFTSAKQVRDCLDDFVDDIEAAVEAERDVVVAGIELLEEQTEAAMEAREMLMRAVHIRAQLRELLEIATALSTKWRQHSAARILNEVNGKSWWVGISEMSTISWGELESKGMSYNNYGRDLVSGPNMAWLATTDGREFMRQIGEAIVLRSKTGKTSLNIRKSVAIPLGLLHLFELLDLVLSPTGYEVVMGKSGTIIVSWRHVPVASTRLKGRGQ